MPDLIRNPVNCSWFPVPAPYSIRGSSGRRLDSGFRRSDGFGTFYGFINFDIDKEFNRKNLRPLNVRSESRMCFVCQDNA